MSDKIERIRSKSLSHFSPVYLVRAYELAKQKMSNEEIADELGILSAVFKSWIKKKPYLRELLSIARNAPQKDFSERSSLTSEQQKFLARYSACGALNVASEGDCQKHYRWLRTDLNGYREAFEQAKLEATDILKTEAWRRGVNGVEKLKFYKGNVIMVPCDADDPEGKFIGVDVDGKDMYEKPYKEHEYSDNVLMFLMKHLSPEFKGDTDNSRSNNITVSIVNEAAERESRSRIIDGQFIKREAERLENLE